MRMAVLRRHHLRAASPVRGFSRTRLPRPPPRQDCGLPTASRGVAGVRARSAGRQPECPLSWMRRIGVRPDGSSIRSGNGVGVTPCPP